MEVEIEYESFRLKNAIAPPTTPPLPRKPKFQAASRTINKSSRVVSLTNQEIAKYWKKKHMDEEDHLVAAIKAAARIHARNLSENDHQQFEESLKENNEDSSKENNKSIKTSAKNDERKYEICIGIKNWWTISKYAYLNQPVTQSMDMPKHRASSSNTPQLYCLVSPSSPATSTFSIFQL